MVKPTQNGIAHCDNSYYHPAMEGISIKLPIDLRRRLALEAKRRNLTQSAIVRECIERALINKSEQRRPANCAELVRDLTGSVSSGRQDLGSNKALLEEAIVGREHRDSKGNR